LLAQLLVQMLSYYLVSECQVSNALVNGVSHCVRIDTIMGGYS
jgi:hypothetical protein